MRNAGVWAGAHRRVRVGRGGIWTSIATVTLLLTALGYIAGSAQAARVHPLLLSESLPEERTPFALAVDQATHHFYVLAGDRNGGDRRIYDYEANGQIDPVDPELTGQPTVLPAYVSVAVDNSGGPENGFVYASDVESHTVRQFDGNWQETSVEIGESAIPPNGTSQGGGLPPVVNPGGFQPTALAVAVSGNIYVNDNQNEVIDEFAPNGTFVAQFAPAKKVSANGMAVDANGDIYIASQSSPEGSGRLPVGLVELNPSGECVQAGCAPIDARPVNGVALDESRATIYTIGTSGTEEGRFSEYDATTGILLGVTRSPELHIPEGIGVNESTGEVILADGRAPVLATGGTVQIYGPTQVVPDVTTLTPSAISVGEATFNGEIGAAGVPGATCAFQYVTAEGFAAHRFEGAAEAVCEPEGPFSGEAMNSVEATVQGLQGGTDYLYRLVGKNANGSNAGEAEEFLTPGPTVGGSEAVELTQTSATLKGSVNPNGSPTSFRFEYLTQAKFEEDGESWAGALEIAGGGVLGGTQPVPVSQRLEGLSPGTAYRFRIVAVSAEGETKGVEVPFATFPSAESALPDGRRYEQVSPLDKNGANVQGGVDSVQAAVDGGAVTFFSQTGIPGGQGSQSFPYYVSRRAADASGWSTEGLLPPASYGPKAAILGWTEDLADTYDFARQPFGSSRILRRDNADGVISQVAPTTVNSEYAFAGSSASGGIALLESSDGGVLSGDLVGKQNLYAYDRETGTLVMAGVLNPTTPGGEPVVPTGGAMAGPYDWWSHGSTTAGGALRTYFTQAGHAISGEGTRVFFTAGETGQLYLRRNPVAPQSAMSGSQCTEVAMACTIRISAPEAGVSDPGTPAAFVGASADGSIVYFLDQGKLTANATGGSGYDLYRYDVAGGILTDVTRDTADKRGARVEGVLGISANGNAAYFVAAGKLSGEAGEASTGETNLYALEGDTIHSIGRLGKGGELGKEEPLAWAPASAGAGGFQVAHASRVSADGQTLVFRSTRQLTGYRNQGVAELYRYQSGAGISCVSCNPSGQAPAGPAGVQEIPGIGVHNAPNSSIMTRNLSRDGRRMIFDSADQLVAADQNNVNDVYEWEAPGKGSCTMGSSAYSSQDEGCLFLISGGAKEAGPSWFGDADNEGENVFFFTDQPLVAQDKDQLVDVYDARVGGGIAAQEEVPPTPCREEAECLPQAEGAPSTSSPRSPSAAGNNVVPPHRCKRGFVRRHGKCVARHKKKHHKHKAHHHHHGKAKRHHAGAKKGGGR